ncbi:MAG TPA: NADH-quinone oxidoreductase subunit J [Mycobacteriales bacterium]|nr:NADH-quinone oxidoreductase subunit J [Mycobacteriales bacterium]
MSVLAAAAPGFRSVSAQEVIFVLLGVLSLGAAVLVVTTRNVVHAALWLVVTLAGVAGCYLMLAAEFLAWVQVLIYVGAVVVLLLFGIMLTKAPIGGDVELNSENRIPAAIVALASAGTLVTLVVDAFRHEYIDLRGGTGAAPVGESIFRSYVLPFEVVSVLLLAALIGSIVLSRRDEENH